MSANRSVRGRRATRCAGAIVVVLACLALAVFITGCGDAGSQPKSALKKFLKQVSKGDVDGSYILLSKADVKQMDRAAWSLAVGALSGGLGNSRFHFIMADAVVEGDTAKVDVLIGDEADTSNAQDVKFLMVKEGGRWKVSYLKTAAGPVRHVETGGGINWSHVAFGSGSESTAKTIVYIIMFAAIFVFYAVSVQRIARVKGMKHPWFAWVPILDIYLAWKIAGKGVISTILTLIPIVNIVMYIIFCFKISRACGKGWVYGLLQLIPFLNLVIFWLLVENVEGKRLEAEPQPA